MELSILFSGIVAISTVVYAMLTWKLTSETRIMRNVQTDPKISIYLCSTQVTKHCLDLIIKNTGMGPAYDVKFIVLEEFDIKKEKKISEIDFIKEGVTYMPPGYSLETLFLNFLETYDEIIDKKLKIQVEYKNIYNNKMSEIITINMSQFKGRLHLGENPIITISKNIEQIKNEISKIAKITDKWARS